MPRLLSCFIALGPFLWRLTSSFASPRFCIALSQALAFCGRTADGHCGKTAGHGKPSFRRSSKAAAKPCRPPAPSRALTFSPSLGTLSPGLPQAGIAPLPPKHLEQRLRHLKKSEREDKKKD